MTEHTINSLDGEFMLDAIAERVVRYRVDDRTITYCNGAWAALHDITPGEAIGHPLTRYLSDDGRAGLHRQLERLGPESPILSDGVARAALGGEVWIEWVDRYIIGPDGPEILSVGRDVTDRRNAELRLADSEARFRDLADNSSDIVWRLVRSPEPHFDYVSPSVETVLGYPPEFFTGNFANAFDVIGDEARRSIRGALAGPVTRHQFDFRFRHRDGSIVICETRTTVLDDAIQGVSRDVTDVRRLQDRLTALASLDPLTGLANRRRLSELLGDALARTQRSGTDLTVAYIDLDGLKHVNDTFGHDVGDLLLCTIARRLVDAVRPDDIVARIGGDEFLVVCRPEPSGTPALAERLGRSLAEPIQLDDGSILMPGASIGTAGTDQVGRDAGDLIAAADQAMYRVKRQRQIERTTRPDVTDPR